MTDLVVIVPTRDRPESAEQLVRAFADTCTADTELVFALDDNAPSLPGYRGVVEFANNMRLFRVGEVTLPSRNMGEALRLAVAAVTSPDAVSPPFAVGFMGDDHRPRTKGWDTAYLQALRELGTGIVYGNDLLQGANLPTQVAMTSDIIRALGHMAPPTLVHMYLDNYWKELGERAGCLRYLPDVVVEHVHPLAQGLPMDEWDEGHRRVNSREMYATDHAAYVRWKYMQMPVEVAKVRALRGERVTISRGRMTEDGPMQPETVTYG